MILTSSSWKQKTLLVSDIRDTRANMYLHVSDAYFNKMFLHTNIQR